MNNKYNEDLPIECFCGCGREVEPVDDHGRARRYIIGHNRRKKSNLIPKSVMVEISKINSLSLAKEVLLNQSKIIYQITQERDELYKELMEYKSIVNNRNLYNNDIPNTMNGRKGWKEHNSEYKDSLT